MSATTRNLLPLLLALLLAAPLRADDEDLEREIAAQAADLPVSVTPRLGLADKTPRRGFVSVQVDLTSRDEAREVRVVLRPVEGEAPLLELGPVTLEAGAPRRVRGLAPARLISDAGALLVEAMSGETRVGVALAYPDPSYDRVLLLLDRHSAPPVDLSKIQTRQTAGRGVREDSWLTASIARADELPENPLAYTGVNAVLLGDLSDVRWSSAQAAALAGWVARGGHLIVSLGARASGLRKSELGRALGTGLDPLPVDPAPIPGSQVTLRRALSRFGALSELEGVSPPVLAPLAPGPGDQVTLRDDGDPGRPLVVIRRHGAGQLTLVAADLWAPPFRHAPHTRRLIEQLLDPNVRYRPRATWLFPKLAEIRQPTQIGPAFAILIIFALIAGPGIYFLLRAKKRGILLWLVIPALTLVFAGLVPLYRLSLRDAESTLVGVRLIEARADDSVSVETIDGLLFSGSLESKELELSGADAAAYAVVPPRRFLRNQKGSPNLGAVLGSAGSDKRLRCELPVALWGARYVSCERTGKLKPISGQVSLGSSPGAPISAEVRYEGYLDLENPVLLIPRGDAVQVHVLPEDLDPGTVYRTANAEGAGAGSYEAEHEGLAAIVGQALIRGVLARQAATQRKAYLVGHTQEPSPLRAKPNVRTRAFATLLVVELPLRYRNGLPWGVVEQRVQAATIASIDSATVEREHLTDFVLPGEARSEPLRKLTLRAAGGRWRVLRDLDLSLLDFSVDPPAWRKVDFSEARRNEEVVRLELDLSEPSRWVSHGGTIRFRQVFQRASRDDDRRHTASLDVSLEWGEPPPKARDEGVEDEEEQE